MTAWIKIGLRSSEGKQLHSAGKFITYCLSFCPSAVGLPVKVCASNCAGAAFKIREDLLTLISHLAIPKLRMARVTLAWWLTISQRCLKHFASMTSQQLQQHHDRLSKVKVSQCEKVRKRFCLEFKSIPYKGAWKLVWL